MSDIAISILNCDFNNIKFELNRINDSKIINLIISTKC